MFSKRSEYSVLLGILLLSFFLNVWNSDFPVEYHGDEYKKVVFLQQGTQNFYHPILMLQAIRSINYFLGLEDKMDVAILGRTFSALWCTLSVFLIYLLSRRQLSAIYALIVALALSLSPIMVIHAHYLKEDMVFCACVLFLLYSLILFLENPQKRSLVFLLGAACGFTVSAKYFGFFFFFIVLVVPILVRIPNKKDIYKKIIYSFCIAFSLFIIINYPLLFEWRTFVSGLNYEIHHAINGHAMRGLTPIKVGFNEYWFGFHLLYSIIPGMTLILTVIALSSLLFVVFGWKRASLQDKIFAIAIFGVYCATEISPMKTPPDFMRYLIPIIPLLIYFAVKGISQLGEWKPLIHTFGVVVLTIGIGYSAWDTLHLDYYLNKDTRDISTKWAAQMGNRVKGESYTNLARDVPSIDMLDISRERANGTEYLMVSNFMYDRYALASQLKNSTAYFQNIYNVYLTLFKQPYDEIRPAYKSFGYSNPTIRIIDIRQMPY